MYYLVIQTCLLVAGAGNAPTIINTIVGTGKAGFTAAGSLATKAQLNEPFHCELDHKDNLYIAEAGNHCIRKVNLKTGWSTIVAGSGRKGYTGDGGKATDATFNEPYAVVVDRDDNLYIVDRLNAVIRKVDAKTGIITTVAGTGQKGFSGDGGQATKAMMREPNDCILDGKGGLLIADVADWRIRRLDLKTGVITTFAGTGKAKIALKTRIDRKVCGDRGPADRAIIVGARAVCVDGKGNTYICEREGSAVRRVDAKGIITTIAGTGEWGFRAFQGKAKRAVFAGPKGIRCDEAGNVYVVDCENHCIRRIDPKSGREKVVAGGRKGAGGDNGPALNAGLNRPHGCIIDRDGTIYIADTNNHRIRAVK
ncbi:MAG: hypothetical protein HYX68_13075 [Planctomycetes bacterium]|jgi:streptogramin lyase|nr:hypothetical protein [Planctomycetota bacterium]